MTVRSNRPATCTDGLTRATVWVYGGIVGKVGCVTRRPSPYLEALTGSGWGFFAFTHTRGPTCASSTPGPSTGYAPHHAAPSSAPGASNSSAQANQPYPCAPHATTCGTKRSKADGTQARTRHQLPPATTHHRGCSTTQHRHRVLAMRTHPRPTPRTQDRQASHLDSRPPTRRAARLDTDHQRPGSRGEHV